ncbi:MAG: co-chaperone GroES [Coprothermobacterota bacterium]|nr:co-chaperone GroES [Coprothermobacterota bacterium]MCX5976773.1 co-chaperone GroES [Coprothermobacterota bacterium]
MNLKPLGDRIVVKVLEGEERTKSGIVIPDTAKEKPQKATVIAIGPGKLNEDNGQRIPMDLQVGQTVIFAKYGGTEIKLNEEEYLILSERDILAVLES